jgi:UDP-N-acetylmuramoyl-tripeptide--D-alanyl-D-alanine ligase
VATALPKNLARFTLAEALLATGGTVSREGSRGSAIGVSTDSRAVSHGEVFVALAGERFDGHHHLRAATEKGASMLVVSRDADAPGGPSIIRVEDTQRALGLLGRAQRRRWGGASHSTLGASPLVGITGSAGKTSTRHATAALFEALGFGPVHASAGNLNNAIGIPMTLLGLEPAHRAAVVEIGMSTPGEIAWGTSLAEPSVGVVTLVGAAHTEGVGSIWGALKEKSDLLAGLAPSAVAVVNADDELARATLVVSRAARFVTYGIASDATVRLVRRTARGLGGAELELDVHGARIEAVVPMLGRAGTYAALAAVATAVAVRGPGTLLDGAAVARGLADLGPGESGRLHARESAGGRIVIDDAYNANPASMRASIDAAREIADALERPLVLVLGAMRELGAESDALHEELGAHAAEARPRAIVSVAAPALAARAKAEGAHVVEVADATAALEAVGQLLAPGDVVLVKASNSIGLSRVAAAL